MIASRNYRGETGAVSNWNSKPGQPGQWALDMQQRLAAGDAAGAAVPFEIQTLAFGQSLAWVTCSAEMVVGYGLRLKAALRRHFSDAMVLAYCNDILGYICTRAQLAEGGYEVNGSMMYYDRPGPWVPGTEDQIVSTALQSLGVAEA